MKVAIAGGTGFIGAAVASSLRARGDEVIIISRSGKPDHPSSEGCSFVTWEQLRQAPALLGGAAAIVNLAGETINQRWTAAAKRRIITSRTEAADKLAEALSALEHKPAVLIQASAVGGYGVSPTATFNESSPLADNDFLSEVVNAWEQAASRIPAGRHVMLRIGLVLDKDGGAFPLMRLPYRLYAGGPMGSGKQWVSWIHLGDLVRLILFCLDHTVMNGPVNGTAPQPQTYDSFGRAIGKAERRPHWFPVPAFALKAALGEMSTLLLDGQRVLPDKAVASGFEYRYPDIDSAMKALLT